MENEKEIINFANSVVSFISKELKLKTPNVIVEEESCCSAMYNKITKVCEIGITIKYVTNYMMSDGALALMKNSPTNLNKKETFLLILLHELGHIVQYQRHLDWYYQFVIPRFERIGFTDKQYRETKLESNADKFASILYKKYSEIILTNSEKYVTI